MPAKPIHILLFFACLFFGKKNLAQQLATDSVILQKQLPGKFKFFSIAPAPSFDKKRFWAMAGTGTAAYTGAAVVMWNAWYKDFPLTPFHTFNDMKEWSGMDKAGHLQAAHLETNFAFQGALWTGMDRRKAMWAAAGVGLGVQTTIEIMDGFSEEWGFSVGDIGFNALGVGAFVAQELLWQEQRVMMKVSSTRPDYSRAPIFSVDGGHQTSLYERADELYGSFPTEVFLKDYNAMTVWASVNLHAFMGERRKQHFPKWLNLAVGYGAGNIYGGFGNEWTDGDGVVFSLDEGAYPRYRQFYLSPDIDLSRIPTKHKWLKVMLGVVNWIKVPAPALELRSDGGFRFHGFYW
ncbi:MAG TPA: DUF2279 domain-containing protein [Bacteroidetes bacterium]|nr:DUF2279 domain-containing protein [Bacteroidota bacterium]